MPATLEVFANTGHQYFSIPLIEAVPRSLSQKFNNSQLELLARNNRGPFERLCQEIPWIRYQFDIVDGKPAIKLAIETNLGINTRGFLFDIEEVDEKPEVDFDVPQFAGRDEIDLESSCGRQFPITSIPTRDGAEFPVDLIIYFAPPGGQNPIDVDLIVDLGNTRTAAILLESPGPANIPLDQRIYPLRILPRGTPFESSSNKPINLGLFFISLLSLRSIFVLKLLISSASCRTSSSKDLSPVGETAPSQKAWLVQNSQHPLQPRLKMA